MIQKRFGLDIPVFVILQEKLEDILSKAPDWWGTPDKDIYDNLIFVMSPATAEIIAEKIGEPTKGLEQICICDNTIFGLSTGINIVDLINPEKLFFIGNRNFEFGGGVCMIGFSIMMWFVSFVILMVAISLLRGNVSTMHGKVFDTTEDKVGYGKQLGKVSLFISIGLCTCGVVAFLIKSSMAIVYALVILLAVIVVSAIWFVFIQKRYMR